MAVSGRRQRDLLGSVAAGSEEDFDHCCEPCLTTGQRIEAHGFCGTCQEYLCSNCLGCHKKAKISRNHNILYKDELDKLHTKQQSYNECTEICSAHKKEIIKFYCPSHNELGCNDCITLGHRTCKIEYIPEKCRRIAEGKEFDDVMTKLSGKLKEAEKISQMAKERSNDINKCNKEIIKAITEFQKEINDRLDQMQQYVSRTAEGIKTKNNRIVQKVLDECASMISDIKSLQSKLNVSKSNNQNSQLFIDTKRAESTLKSNELNDTGKTLINTNLHYSFERNSDLESLLSKTMVFGEIVSHSCYETPQKMKSVDHLIGKGDININVKTSSDTKECLITGCAVLNTNKLVLADNENNKIKIISIENRLVQEEKSLDSDPWDIAVMSQDQFAATLPNIKKIVVMTRDDKISCVRSIKLDRYCYGIDFNQDCLFVACLYPPSVIVLNTQSDILNNVPLKFLSNVYIPYITVKKDSKLLYISDFSNHSIVSASLQGEVTATYKKTDLSGPQGVLVLDDRSLLVCCYNNGTIHKVNEDLKQGNIMSKGANNPRSICFSAHHDEVYVGCFGNNLKIFSTK